MAGVDQSEMGIRKRGEREEERKEKCKKKGCTEGKKGGRVTEEMKREKEGRRKRK